MYSDLTGTGPDERRRIWEPVYQLLFLQKSLYNTIAYEIMYLKVGMPAIAAILHFITEFFQLKPCLFMLLSKFFLRALRRRSGSFEGRIISIQNNTKQEINYKHCRMHPCGL